METYKIIYRCKTLERLGWIDDKISQWQKKMQDPKLSTYVEFIKYAKIVTKLSKERMKILSEKNIVECNFCKDTGFKKVGETDNKITIARCDCSK